MSCDDRANAFLVEGIAECGDDVGCAAEIEKKYGKMAVKCCIAEQEEFDVKVRREECKAEPTKQGKRECFKALRALIEDVCPNPSAM